MNIEPEKLHKWDKRFVWHPFTPMGAYMEGDPVMIERGEGVRLQDVEGRWYYDGVSSVWVNVHGHNVPAINEAIEEQLDKIAHSTLLGQANVPSTQLARRLAEVSPGDLRRVFYSDSGATAVEIALKMAIQYWANQGQDDKKYVLGFTNNYHGDTIGAMGVAPDENFHWAFTHLLPDHPRVPYPYPYRCAFDADDPEECLARCMSHLHDTLEEDADRLAAVILEPVEGAGGIIVPPDGFLAEVRALCSDYDVLMIADEVATGFGRTGRLFACDHESVTPDILCLGKGITGGYLPVAATMASEAIFDKFLGERREALLHGHSYTGNQLGCAAALASLDLLDERMPALPEKVDVIERELEPFVDLPYIGDVRQAGFMCGLEIVADRETKEPFPPEEQVGYIVAAEARDRGLLIRPIGRNVIFMPPLASTPEQLEEMLLILYDAFRAAAPALNDLAGRAH